MSCHISSHKESIWGIIKRFSMTRWLLIVYIHFFVLNIDCMFCCQANKILQKKSITPALNFMIISLHKWQFVFILVRICWIVQYMQSIQWFLFYVKRQCVESLRNKNQHQNNYRLFNSSLRTIRSPFSSIRNNLLNNDSEWMKKETN